MPIVMNPTAGDVHVNTPLTNFSQKWIQDQAMFIGLNAMPNNPVSKQSDLYYNFSRADFNRIHARKREDGTESAGAGFKLATDPYFAFVYALHKDITDRQRANADTPVNLERSSTEFVTQQLMLLRETLFRDTFLPTSEADKNTAWGASRVWVGNASPTGEQFGFFDNANSDPIVDVRRAMDAVHLATGFRPNRIAIGRSAWSALLDNDAILARITGGTTPSQPAVVMRALIAQLFEVDQIFVGGSVVNAGEDQNNRDNINAGEANSFVIGDDMLIYFAPNTPSLESPTAGQQFSWTGFMGATAAGMRIRRFRSEKTQSDRIEGEMAFDYKITSQELAIAFHNCVT